MLLISLLPLLGVIQPGPSRAGAQNDPDIEAAVVIAHGVMPRVDGEVAWRVRPYRAALPHRSNVSVHPAGFVLADLDAIGVVGMSGKLLSRLAPGQAVWTPPGAPTAIVSLEERPVSYGEIALVPASELSGAEWELAGAPFVLPRGEAFDLNLAQGVVARGEERAVDNGIGSALLLVTSGKVRVRVETGAGDAAEVAEGEVRELDRAVTVSGAHHEPSAFVVALIAARTPAELTLRDVPRPTIAPALTPTATPSPTPSPTAVPTQTPAPTPTIAPAVPATVAISSFICPVAYDGSDYAAVCTSPSTGVEFSVSDGEAAVQTAVAGEEGYVTFDDLETGEVVVAAGVPGDFASSRVRCLNVFGEDIARRAEINQIALTLEAGDDIACDWYIVPEDARGEAPAPALVGNGSVSIHVRACPPGMTVETLDADACGEPPAGTSLSLLADGVPLGIYSVETDLWWWQNLPYRSFDLLVNAIPEGFAEASLGSRTCCNAAGGYDVLTSQETPDTGYILYLYPPATATAIPEPEAVATEVAVPESPVEVVDPDGDGLPTADEDGFFGTDPEDADSDGDGVSDVAEIAAGTDPLDGGDS